MQFLAFVPPPAGPPPQEAPSAPAAPAGPPPQEAPAAPSVHFSSGAAHIDGSAVAAAIAQLEAGQEDEQPEYSEVEDEEDDANFFSDDADLEKKH